MTSDSRKWFALAVICVAQFMVILDVSIVNFRCLRFSAAYVSPSRTCCGS